MQQKLATMQIIAGLLGILLVIAIIVVVNQHKTITELKCPAKQNITAQRDIIREDCTATDPNSVERCADDLQALSDLLAQFSKAVHTGTSTPIKGLDGAVNNIKIDKLPKK